MAVGVYIDSGGVNSVTRLSASAVRVNLGVTVHADYGCRYWRATVNGAVFASVTDQAGSYYLEGSADLSVGPGAGTASLQVVAYAQPFEEEEGSSSPAWYAAAYPAQVYTVTFDPGEGSVTETSRSVAYGAALGTLPAPAPPAGYGFRGWYDGDTPVTAETLCAGSVTLLAHYAPQAILHLVGNGTPETVTDIRVVENGTPKQVLSVWSVTSGVPKQGV